MENSSSLDESSDLGYQPSSSSLDQNDRSTAETPGYSTMSGDSFVFGRTYSETSAFSDPIDDNSYSSEPSPSHWTAPKSGAQNQTVARRGMKQHKQVVDDKIDDQELADSGGLHAHSFVSFLWQNIISYLMIKMARPFCITSVITLTEIEMVKERFAKLLLGEDMSGSGKGVCTAVTISNAITNLYGKSFKHITSNHKMKIPVFQFFTIAYLYYFMQQLCLGKI